MKILLIPLLALPLLAQEPTTNLVAHPGTLQIAGEMDQNGVITPGAKTIPVLQPIVQVTNPDTRTQELLSGLIALATTAFGIWMRYQKAKAVTAHIGTIQGVEEIRQSVRQSEKGRELDERMVEILRRHQEAVGAVAQVEKLIEKHTGSTTSQSQIKDLL